MRRFEKPLSRLDNYCSDNYYAGMSTTPSLRASAARRFDSPEQEAFLNLWRTYDRLKTLEDELFGRFTPALRALCLKAISRKGKLPRWLLKLLVSRVQSNAERSANEAGELKRIAVAERE